MQLEEIIGMAEDDNPSPLLLISEAGLGYQKLALEAAKRWSAPRQPTDYSEQRLVMSSSGEGLPIQELLKFLSFSASERRSVILNLSGSSLEVQNALLKNLEEPPAFTWIIIMLDSNYSLLPTVKSRCNLLQAGRIGSQEMEELGCRIGAEQQQIKMANGNPVRLQWIIDNRLAVQALHSGDVSTILSLMNDQEKAAPWLSELLALAEDQPGSLRNSSRNPLDFSQVTQLGLLEARQLVLSGARPELALASLFLL